MPIYLANQNAGLIIRRQPNHFVFEGFELTPPDQIVNSSAGALKRTFPSTAVQVEASKVLDEGFRNPLANFISEMAHSADEYDALKFNLPPQRQSPNPCLITHLLIAFLQATGQAADTIRIHKRTREDAVYCSSLVKLPYQNRSPWRRLALWLLLRVFLQSSLMQHSSTGLQTYKCFMTYFKARILRLAINGDLPSDNIFPLLTNVSRRVLKLDLDEPPLWYETVAKVMNAASGLLQKKWNTVKAREASTAQSELSTVQFSMEASTSLKFSALEKYLRPSSRQSSVSSSSSDSDLSGLHRVRQDHTNLPQLMPPGSEVDSATNIRTIEMEVWVQDHLDKWLASNISRREACEDIANLIETYIETIHTLYQDQPMDQSLAFLTLMELWVALDKCARRQEQLIEQYDVPIPQNLFDALLLPERRQMQRLQAVEDYAAKRKQTTNEELPSILKSPNHPQSFGVRYVDNSLRHQGLRQTAEAHGRKQCEDKRADFRKKKEEYRQLLTCIQQVEHDECLSLKRRNRSKKCFKCRLEIQAEEFTTEVHEWPLPQNDVDIKAILFELDVPKHFARWRDATYAVLVDALSPALRPSRSYGFTALQSYQGLLDLSTPNPRRVKLASLRLRASELHIKSATTENICTSHKRTWSLTDGNSKSLTSEGLHRCDLRDTCTPELPPGSYSGLSFALKDTTHTSNEVISRQHQCPQDLSVHEFYAYGTLRSGHRIQWRNIARQLAIPDLDLKSESVQILISQAVLQAGPRGNRDSEYRESHADLEDPAFCVELLDAMRSLLRSTEGNWQNIQVATTLITLGLRILSMAPNEDLSNRYVDLLRQLRRVLFEWLLTLNREAQSQANEEGEALWKGRVFQCAYECLRTFFADSPLLDRLLNSDGDVEVAITCSILCHDHIQCFAQDADVSRVLEHRLMSISCRMEKVLRRMMVKTCEGQNRAITRLWSDQYRLRTWTPLENGHRSYCHWLTSTTVHDTEDVERVLHYNILKGTLLVDGSPFSKLPTEYMEHPVYEHLFKEVSRLAFW